MPLDVRLHGVWSTLAYFAGLKVWIKGDGDGDAGLKGGQIGNGKKVLKTVMEERVEEGERIAEAGREWAGKVLRKEDMEIYMFRLLLEWGRLTDDRRDELGYGM